MYAKAFILSCAMIKPLYGTFRSVSTNEPKAHCSTIFAANILSEGIFMCVFKNLTRSKLDFD